MKCEVTKLNDSAGLLKGRPDSSTEEKVTES